MMMDTAIEVHSEVHFKEKLEEEGVKAETPSENAPIWFNFRASTPAMSLPGRGRKPGQRTERNDGSSRRNLASAPRNMMAKSTLKDGSTNSRNMPNWGSGARWRKPRSCSSP